MLRAAAAKMNGVAGEEVVSWVGADLSEPSQAGYITGQILHINGGTLLGR